MELVSQSVLVTYGLGVQDCTKKAAPFTVYPSLNVVTLILTRPNQQILLLAPSTSKNGAELPTQQSMDKLCFNYSKNLLCLIGFPVVTGEYHSLYVPLLRITAVRKETDLRSSNYPIHLHLFSFSLRNVTTNLLLRWRLSG
jgi:hypothetical protein